MKIYTYYTSLLFLVASFRTAGCWMQTWLAIVACISTLHHSKITRQYPGKSAVVIIDRVVAHKVAIRALIQAMLTPFTRDNVFWLLAFYACLSYTVCMYYLRLRGQHNLRLQLHSTIHMSGALGIICAHRAIYGKPDFRHISW